MTRASPAFDLRYKSCLLLFLIAASSSTFAQTPIARMMPDGSSDLYAGIGIASAPRRMGSDTHESGATALIQMQWSNGVFLSGLSAGMHLSTEPRLEYGPLLAIEPGRDASGAGRLSGVGDIGGSSIASPSAVAPGSLQRIPDVPSRPTAGGFFNYYLDEGLRVTSNVLYGSGRDRHGLLASVGLQKAFTAIPHHRLSLTLGANWGNRDYQAAYFGVPATEVNRSAGYAPSAGLRDLQVIFHWNWELSNTWLLTSRISVSRLMGDAASSPLTERRHTASLRTGLAYRF